MLQLREKLIGESKVIKQHYQNLYFQSFGFSLGNSDAESIILDIKPGFTNRESNHTKILRCLILFQQLSKNSYKNVFHNNENFWNRFYFHSQKKVLLKRNVEPKLKAFKWHFLTQIKDNCVKSVQKGVLSGLYFDTFHAVKALNLKKTGTSYNKKINLTK